MKTYTPTIGLEIHVELKTKTKMFCDSLNNPHAEKPNEHVCPICMGHPGTLPVVNEQAVQHVLTVGLALNSELATYTEFDRKNYFYPDIPKGYQISQYLYPLVKGGSLNDVQITRVHLEEDTARSLHDQGEGSIIDFNRAGVPLMELVTEPVIHDAKTAGNFARELQLLLRTLGVSDANMEKGEMRVEANISISDSDTFGTKVEVKNLNSFKSVENAIEYEIKRQKMALESGEMLIQETRGWDEMKNRTFSQRVKETANDYRYFPDPDIPKFLITEDMLSRLKDVMPKLPAKKREIYGNLGLTREQIEILISDSSVNSFFDLVLDELSGEENLDTVKIAANYLITDLFPLRSSDAGDVSTWNANFFARLVRMIQRRAITSRVAKDILFDVVCEGNDPEKLATERGLLQDSSDETISKIVAQIVLDNPTVVADFKSGKAAALQFLVGQGMRLSKGSANPERLSEIFKETIL